MKEIGLGSRSLAALATLLMKSEDLKILKKTSLELSKWLNENTDKTT